jgi:leucyl aminopeptidase
MKITLSKDSAKTTKAHIVAVGVRDKELGKNATVKSLDSAMKGALSAHAKDESFTGKLNEVLKVPAGAGVAARWVVLVGLGAGKASPADALRVAVHGARSAKKQSSVAVVLPKGDAASARAAAQGLLGGAYRYDRYLTGSRRPEGEVKTGYILGAKADAPTRAAVKDGEIIGDAVNFARDLVNAPPNDLTPEILADTAAAKAKGTGIRTTIWNKAKIEKAGMRLFLAVNQGGGNEPRFIHMVYKPKSKAKAKVAFVGKGLTFDSGGLCIKPAKAMYGMKCDMAGSATTFGVVVAAARLKLPVEVHALVGSTENMSGDFAYRPGDVFESLDGKMVEIINTDAEGRLVLADVLAYARDKVKPDYMVDHATLTGACMVALGKWRAALYANDDKFGKAYGDAAERAAENFWHMPLDEALAKTLKSDIADLKHTGDAHGGSITAALFLREFVGNTKWVHCDIAGPAFLEQGHDLAPVGGTGFGVATGVEFLRGLAEKK